MKKSLFSALVLAALVPSSWATISYNETITTIYGSGNLNMGWTADTANGIQLALRAKNRSNGTANNVNGVYSYATAPAPRGLWNYDFSINSGDTLLSAYDYYLAVDRDSSQGINYNIISPLSYWLDNSYGNTSTLNGQGVEGTDTLAAANYLVQNSQNITFGGLTGYPGGALTLEANATYSFELWAVEKGSGSDGARLASVAMTVVVGDGGPASAPVAIPDAGSTCGLLGIAFAGLVGFRRKFASR